MDFDSTSSFIIAVSLTYEPCITEVSFLAFTAHSLNFNDFLGRLWGIVKLRDLAAILFGSTFI